MRFSSMYLLQLKKRQLQDRRTEGSFERTELDLVLFYCGIQNPEICSSPSFILFFKFFMFFQVFSSFFKCFCSFLGLFDFLVFHAFTQYLKKHFRWFFFVLLPRRAFLIFVLFSKNLPTIL